MDPAIRVAHAPRADAHTGQSSLAAELRRAAQIVSRIAEGQPSSPGEGPIKDGVVSRAAVHDLVHGTLRRFGRVQAFVRTYTRRSPIDPLIEALLWCAYYALESGRYTVYTVVDQAATACKLMHKPAATGFVNAVLRSHLRHQRAFDQVIRSDMQARFQHPQWWIDKLRSAYSSGWEEILSQSNVHPPMTLRLNRRRTNSNAYEAKLALSGLPHRLIGQEGVLLERPVPVERLPGFADGELSVQDLGAQRAAHLLELLDGQRVLDACAAPGGKSAHILELADVKLTAMDIDPTRCERITHTFGRLGLTGQVVCADCTDVSYPPHGAPFDRILADVPCSASGTVRRNPDIKWVRRESDIRAYAERQSRMLEALWRVLGQGGKLLYATCSVFPEENEHVVARFCERMPDARRRALSDGGAAQWLPTEEHDGFYYAMLEKVS